MTGMELAMSPVEYALMPWCFVAGMVARDLWWWFQEWVSQ